MQTWFKEKGADNLKHGDERASTEHLPSEAWQREEGNTSRPKRLTGGKVSVAMTGMVGKDSENNGCTEW